MVDPARSGIHGREAQDRQKEPGTLLPGPADSYLRMAEGLEAMAQNARAAAELMAELIEARRNPEIGMERRIVLHERARQISLSFIRDNRHCDMDATALIRRCQALDDLADFVELGPPHVTLSETEQKQFSDLGFNLQARLVEEACKVLGSQPLDVLIDGVQGVVHFMVNKNPGELFLPHNIAVDDIIHSDFVLSRFFHVGGSRNFLRATAEPEGLKDELLELMSLCDQSNWQSADEADLRKKLLHNRAARGLKRSVAMSDWAPSLARLVYATKAGLSNIRDLSRTIELVDTKISNLQRIPCAPLDPEKEEQLSNLLSLLMIPRRGLNRNGGFFVPNSSEMRDAMEEGVQYSVARAILVLAREVSPFYERYLTRTAEIAGQRIGLECSLVELWGDHGFWRAASQIS